MEPEVRLYPMDPWDHDLSRNQELDAYQTEPPRHLHTFSKTMKPLINIMPSQRYNITKQRNTLVKGKWKYPTFIEVMVSKILSDWSLCGSGLLKNLEQEFLKSHSQTHRISFWESQRHFQRIIFWRNMAIFHKNMLFMFMCNGFITAI